MNPSNNSHNYLYTGQNNASDFASRPHSSTPNYLSFDQNNSSQYVSASQNSGQPAFPSNRYRISSPLVHRYTRSTASSHYVQQPGVPATSPGSPTFSVSPSSHYFPHSGGQPPPPQFPPSRRNPPPAAQPRDFISTPTEILANYNNSSRQFLSNSSTYQHVGGSTSASTSRGDTIAPERFVCDLCGKDFSRSHDRKRHYSTSHDVNGEKHVCEYCKKTFSRGDSLKRHRDNGCDSYDARKH